MTEWQPISTAPHGRPILLDMSYWYPHDTGPTEVYVVGYYSASSPPYVWECGDEVYLETAPNGWTDIPRTNVKRDSL